jgi:glycosyltransferase involved in cell wall biosynthesis
LNSAHIHNAAPDLVDRKPRVLIGVPVFNGERFLADALDSLLAQTLPGFEILISDNASTDRTQAICERYASIDPRVTYVRQEVNIGAPLNWNFVARANTCEYFKWASANDTVAPTMLQRCVDVLDADEGVVLAQGRTILVDEDTGATEAYSGDLALAEACPSDRLRSLILNLALNNGQSGVIRAAALRRTRLDRIYPNGDFVLMAELALQGRFAVLPDQLLFRRIGPTSFSTMLGKDDERRFFDPRRGTSLRGRQVRLHLDLLRSVLTANLPLPERVRCIDHVLRKIWWAVSNAARRRDRHQVET